MKNLTNNLIRLNLDYSMPSPLDWLSQLLAMVPVSGRLDTRCYYGAPWNITYDPSPEGEMPYHIVLKGSAVVNAQGDYPLQHLQEGDIILFAHGSAHILHDGGATAPGQARFRQELNFVISENAGVGDRLEMLCGRFIVKPPYDRLLRSYLPPRLIVRAAPDLPADQSTAGQLASLVGLMRHESASPTLGAHAMLGALSAALFTLALRRAGEEENAPSGLLAMAGHPRLAPALNAILNNPAHPWTLENLAELCNMSRATLARHFKERIGRTTNDLLTDVRMTQAINELKNPSNSTELVAERVGYQSISAFQKTFKRHIGMSPAQWRKHQMASS
ncbi:cupin domain-containing protein [Pseudomonas sp. NPDC090202]|uniref:cupin domain-containing protein n=1 Tax=Pseudomonas sp. NPDC090202 TaxID=3364476 RepID=UPI00382BC610